MGQKIHPYGFRLGIHKLHYSNWFALKNSYALHLGEDRQIRQFFQLFQLQYPNAGILDIQINRQLNNHISVSIFCSKSNFFIKNKQTNLKDIQRKLQIQIAQFSQNHQFMATKTRKQPLKISIHIIEASSSEKRASFLADFLIDQLEKRVAFRRALKKTLKRAEKSRLNGIKIQISGRLNGAEIARTEWVREGRVPLQTLKADIDYVSKNALTIYGLLGIKIWIFNEN